MDARWLLLELRPPRLQLLVCSSEFNDELLRSMLRGQPRSTKAKRMAERQVSESLREREPESLRRAVSELSASAQPNHAGAEAAGKLFGGRV